MTCSCLRDAVYSSYSPPHTDAVARRQLDTAAATCRCASCDRAGQVAALDRVLHADVARVVLAIDERRAVARRWMSANSRSGTCCPPGVATRMLPIASGVSRILRLQPDDEIERPLALHHLRRRTAADRGLDQAVDVGDVEAVARDLGAVDRRSSGSAGRAPGRASRRRCPRTCSSTA